MKARNNIRNEERRSQQSLLRKDVHNDRVRVPDREIQQQGGG